jgi:cbb3-type cytochrome oxidase subunit 3
VALAQDAGAAASDLQANNVTFEENAVTQADIAELDETTAGLQEGGAFKVVVLGEPVSDYANADEFATAVLDDLGEDGRVLVYTPNTVGLASSVDSGAEVASAKQAAIDTANQTNSFAAGVEAAAADLGVQGAEAGDDGGGGGGGLLLLLLLLLVPLALLIFFLWRSRKRQKQMAAGAVETAEGRIRAEVDASANLILDLNDRVELPGAAPEAKELFQQGARLFTEVQEPLEEADTPAELEAVYPKIVETRWKLESAQALLDGKPAPAQPTPEPLFPEPEPVPVPVEEEAYHPEPEYQPLPEQHYRQYGASPWLTGAAMAALSMLAAGGMGQPRISRPPMGDDVFFDSFGGGYGGGGMFGGGSSGRPRINLGGGRGMGRR